MTSMKEEQWALAFISVILLLAATFGCGRDMALPELPKPPSGRETRIKPGKAVRLNGLFAPGRRYETFRIRNLEPFAWTILDDVWLTVSVPAGSILPGRGFMSEHHVELRCPNPRAIPAGAEIEISFATCTSTTYIPPPGAHASAFRLVAREGYLESGMEPALEDGRPR
jgi:hypothetical protein